MAQHDFTISDAEYNQMMAVLNAMRTRLALLKQPLRTMCRQEAGKAKVKAFAATEAGRFLREVYRIKKDVKVYFDDLLWEDDD